MPGFLRDQWDEFDWEKELKKDDARISAYMQELPLYIDLPGEDAVIMKHILDKPELVPMDVNKNTYLAEMFNPSADEEEETDLSDDWQKRDGAPFFMAAGRLARLWALHFATIQSSPAATESSMKILCYYGKICAQCADLIEMEEEEFPKLKLAIVKRLFADLNALMGELRHYAESFPNQTQKTDFHFDQLMNFREKLFALLHKYRSNKKD